MSQTDKLVSEVLTSLSDKNWYNFVNQAMKNPQSVRASTISTKWYDVSEGFEYHIDVPGFLKEELSLVYEDKTRSVTISGSKSTVIGDRSLNRTINQTVRLPEEAQPSISASLENGVLVLSVPREQNLRKTILIQ